MTKLSENLIREISGARAEPCWLLDARMTAFKKWQQLKEPHWADIDYSPIDYDSLNYFKTSAPIDNSDLKAAYVEMGLPEAEQKALLGMATDTVIDSGSVHTSYSEELKKLGIIFMPLSRAAIEYPELVKKYIFSVVPADDNFFACLNAAVFSDGTFVYVPQNTKCPIELASFFRIETANIGQFERTLIIADKGSELSYMEGCSAPRRPNHQLHSGVVEVIVMDDAVVKYSTVQNWYRGNDNGQGGILNFVTKRGTCHKNAKLQWTQVEVGSAMTWKYPGTILAGENAESDFYSLSLSRGYQQADTGTKMIHLATNTKSNIVSYGIALENSKQTFRSFVSFAPNVSGAVNASKCDSRIVGKNASANAKPVIIHNNGKNDQSHEATAGVISRDALLYLNQSGIGNDEATALIIAGAAAPVISRLPMEFLVESKQMIQMALRNT